MGILVGIAVMGLVGASVFLMVMDIAHWKRRGPTGFEVERRGEREE